MTRSAEELLPAKAPSVKAPPVKALPIRHILREGTAGQVVIVHPGALAAKVHENLAAVLPSEVGVVVLDLQGVSAYAAAAMTGGVVAAGVTVTTMAEQLAGELDAVLHPSAPYVLVGWSFGGVVAHQLTCSPALGRAPERLVLLDSISAGDGYQATVEELGDVIALTWFEMYLGAKRPQGNKIQSTSGTGNTGSTSNTESAGAPSSLAEVLDRGLAAGTLRPGTSIDGLNKAYSVFVDGLRRNTALSNPHRPRISAVPTSVVRAERSLLAEPGTLGYADLVPAGAELLTVPGDHYSMLAGPTAVAVVAAICSRYLGIPAGAEPRGVNLERLS